MIIFPAIDILNGKCVRLIQGDYNKEQIYSDSPVDMAIKWEKEGASFIHIVDLNGAKTGESINKPIIEKIAANVAIPIQVGGGIRSIDVIEQYIEAGVERVIIGTAAISNPTFLLEAVEKFSHHIAVSIDAKNGYVATDGWTDTSEVRALELVKKLEKIGVETIIYTDIAKDGMLQGPNIEEQNLIHKSTTMNVIASGGITKPTDIQALQSLHMYGAIVGKALYDGKVSLQQLLEVTSK